LLAKAKISLVMIAVRRRAGSAGVPDATGNYLPGNVIAKCIACVLRGDKFRQDELLVLNNV
jgi:hypothetical protein